jgi:hypothetical protein
MQVIANSAMMASKSLEDLNKAKQEATDAGVEID